MNFIKLSLWGKNEAFFLSVAAIASIATTTESKAASVITSLYGTSYLVEGTPATVMERILQAQSEAAVGATHVPARETQTFAGERRV